MGPPEKVDEYVDITNTIFSHVYLKGQVTELLKYINCSMIYFQQSMYI